jgi:hypothetical protein
MKLKDKRLRDGLYRVNTPYFCGGFIVKNGVVTWCAPILRKRLSYWMKYAEYVCE